MHEHAMRSAIRKLYGHRDVRRPLPDDRWPVVSRSSAEFIIGIRFFLFLFVVRRPLLLGFPDRQQFHVTGWKNKGLHKAQPIRIQSSPHDFAAVALAELTKGFRVNNLSLEPTCLEDSAPQQSTIN